MTGAGELRIYRSPIIDSERFWHGFPERGGGVSTGPRASLNLGYRWGDSEERVTENLRIVAEHVGYRPEDLVVTQHVHGTAVWTVGETLPEPPEFDGMVCDVPGKVLGAFAADCIPLLFVAPAAKVCGAAHAGWRGTVNGMAVSVVERMCEKGADVEDLRVALGPSIGPCCFEVGDEVVEAFARAFPSAPGLIVDGPRKKHVDLRVATRAQLQAVGVRAEHIDDRPPCTQCNPERFFSYRRDGREGGIHMGFVGIKP